MVAATTAVVVAAMTAGKMTANKGKGWREDVTIWLEQGGGSGGVDGEDQH